MTFKVTIVRTRAYVHVVVAGPTSLAGFTALVAQVAGQVEPGDRVLLDLRQVEGRLSTSEQQTVGELGATRFPMLHKLASVVPRGEITRNSERTAIDKGLQVRVFDSEAGALAWLLEPAANDGAGEGNRTLV